MKSCERNSTKKQSNKGTKAAQGTWWFVLKNRHGEFSRLQPTEHPSCHPPKEWPKMNKPNTDSVFVLFTLAYYRSTVKKSTDEGPMPTWM